MPEMVGLQVAMSRHSRGGHHQIGKQSNKDGRMEDVLLDGVCDACLLGVLLTGGLCWSVGSW